MSNALASAKELRLLIHNCSSNPRGGVGLREEYPKENKVVSVGVGEGGSVGLIVGKELLSHEQI
jgi:hypothetical protein